MFNSIFNKKATKRLIKSNPNGTHMTKLRLDWLLDDGRVCGCLCNNIFGRNTDIFLIQKVDDTYRLIHDDCRGLYIYLILDIEEFLKYVSVEELYCSDQDAVRDIIESTATFTPGGTVEIQDDKIFMLDFISRS